MISYAAHNHTTAIRQLWKEVFQDSDAFLDLYFQQIFQANQCIVSVEDGELCAAMQVLPYTYMHKGKSLKAAYIFAVMTHPKKRKQGHMSHLFEFAIKELQQQDVAFIFLIPQTDALFAMYKKLGFYPAFRQAKNDIALPTLDAEIYHPSNKETVTLYKAITKQRDVMLHADKYLDFQKQLVALEGGAAWAVKNQALCFVVPSSKGLRVLDLLSKTDMAKELLLSGLQKIYQVDTAIVSSFGEASNNALGMVKILQTDKIAVQDLQDTYLSLMMNE